MEKAPKRPRGRPRKDPIGIYLTLAPELLRALEEWAVNRYGDPPSSRQEAIRRILADYLAPYLRRRRTESLRSGDAPRASRPVSLEISRGTGSGQTLPDEASVDKVRELRLRRMASRRGYRLSRSRVRDPRAVGFGLYALVDENTGKAVNPDIVGRWKHSWTLDEVEKWLRGDEAEASAWLASGLVSGLNQFGLNQTGLEGLPTLIGKPIDPGIGKPIDLDPGPESGGSPNLLLGGPRPRSPS